MALDVVLGGSALVGATAACHGAALIASIPAAVLRRKALLRLGLVLLALAFVLNTWVILGRWIEAGRPPFKTMYETLLFYPWCVALVTLVLIALHRLHILIPFASGISLFGLAYALYRPDMEVVKLPPALQSAWFVPHVVIYFVAYAGLFASFALALLALAAPWWQRKPGAAAKDRGEPVALAKYAHRAAIFGTIALTFGLLMGAVWGKYAWGDYWSWDPKENWALVTWLAYLIYLHLRRLDRWWEQRAMWVLVFSFGAVVFTYLGMSLLPTASGSLHVYQ